MSDIDKLSKWIKSEYAPRCDRVNLSPASSGFSAESLFCDLIASNGQISERLVVRLEKPGGEVFLDSDIAVQKRVMKALKQPGIPVPEVRFSEMTGALLGRRFLATTRIEGRNFPQAPNYYTAGWVLELDSAKRSIIWRDALTVMGRLNRLSTRDGFGFLERPGYGRIGIDQYLGWLQMWRDDVFGHEYEHPVIDKGLAFARSEKPESLPVNVVWGDSNPSNMLFDSAGRLCAILDFEACTLGPAEIDLGWWFFLDRSRARGRPLLSGVPDRGESIDIYSEALGREAQSVDYFEMLGGIKMALVIASTAKRLKHMGLIDSQSRVEVNNPQSGTLAKLIGADIPEVGLEFERFVAAVNRR